MDGDSIRTILGMCFLVLCSAYFSATETAFSTLSRVRVKTLADGGSKRAALVLRLSEDYDKLLSTILVGNNIVNIAMASIATVMFVRLLGGSAGPTVSTAVTTVVVLVFGEISPKSLAKESPESFAMFSAPFLQVLMVVLTPINFVFSQWKKLLSKLVKSSDDRAITEAELLTLVEEAELEGAIGEEDRNLINSVIEFNDSKAGDILTPRVDIEGVPLDATTDEISALFVRTGFSRIPVFEESIDRITGVVHLRDFFEFMQNGGEFSDIVSPVVAVAPSIRISALLKLLQDEKCHLAVVTDEYGGTEGIVTMEDILEELVGEIWDEHDEVIEEFTKLPDGSYKIACSADIDEMLKYFELEGEFESTSVSGWVMEELGRVPDEGDAFEYENLSVRVTKTDHRRVVEIVVTVLPA